MSSSAFKILSVVWLIAVTVLSLWPAAEEELPLFKHSDKIVHFFMYGILSGLMVRARLPRSRIRKVAAVVFATMYGLLMELLQEVSGGGRAFEWGDAAANFAGALTGVLIVKLSDKKVSLRKAEKRR